MGGHVAAVTDRRDGRQEGDAHLQARGRGNRAQALPEAGFADIGGGGRRPASGIDIAQGNRHDAGAGIECGLQQRSVEGQHAVAEAGRAFREHGDTAAAAEHFGDVLLGLAGSGTRTTGKEYRLGAAAQPADQRPGAHIVLGDEGRRCEGVDGEDVEPGNVVRYQQAFPWHRTERQQADAEGRQELS
jgi:hypothetical protein